MTSREDAIVHETAPSAEGIVARIVERHEQTRTFGRDIDDLFKQLHAAVVSVWPRAPERSAALVVEALAATHRWAARTTQMPRSLRLASDVLITRLARDLQALADEQLVDHVTPLLDAWCLAADAERDLIARLFLERAGPLTLAKLDAQVSFRATHARHRMGSPGAAPNGDVAGARAREFVVLLARVRAAQGRVDEAIAGLEDESGSDPRVLCAHAEILSEAGRGAEALERLRRCLIVLDDKARIRERIFDAYLADGEYDLAVEQQFLLLEETGDVLYWDVLGDALAPEQAERIAILDDELRDRAPALHIEVLISRGDVDAVAAAARAKTFSFQQLWRIGDFLAAHDHRKAATVYERAMTLEGAVAQSKVECADFGTRIEGVLPYFERIGRTTKPRRIARAALGRAKNNVPLRRELERIFPSLR